MQHRVYQTPGRDMTDLKQLLTDKWNGLLQCIVYMYDAVVEWRKRLRAYVKEKGRHLNICYDN